MKRIIVYFAVPFLCPLIIAICLIFQPIAARSASRAQRPDGPSRSVCLTNCLRTYEKCQRRAKNDDEMAVCYQQFTACQQKCYASKTP
jgi:hypothetical protein